MQLQAKDTLAFLNELVQNNNREWFQANKARYDVARHNFADFTEAWIAEMRQIVPNLGVLTAKDCIWRIYRDTRFSLDKTPYKDHFGSFVAQHGGKKSPYGGYYLHLQPGACMFAAGMWCPEPDLLKKLRQAIYDNADELTEIIQNPSFQLYFNDLDKEYTLKKLPAGYRPDDPYLQQYPLLADWLKLKMFCVSCPLTDEQVAEPNFMQHLLELCRITKPLNDFLNYTLEEE